MQPIDHLGLMASTDVGPVTLGAAIVNQINLLTSSPDVNSEKSYLGRIAFAPSDMFSLATTVAYGAESPAFTISGDHDKTGLLDVLANFNSDAFSAYVNADYGWVEGSSLAAWGVSIAGLVPLTDVLSASLRLEYLRDKHNNSGTANFFPILDTNDHSEIYGATGTLAYEIAENLTVKGEVRWDHVEEEAADGTHEFITKTGGGSHNQTVGLAQVVYAF